MKNLVHLFTSYMRLAVISMFLSAICFAFYAAYKTRNEFFLQMAGGGLAALFAVYVVLSFLSVKLAGLPKSEGATGHPPASGRPHVYMTPGKSMPVSSTLSRALVAIFVLVCNGVALITYAKSKGWPIKIAVWSFSTFVLAAILFAIIKRSDFGRPPSGAGQGS